MHQVTLQAYSYRSMVERCQRLQDSSLLAASVRAVFADPQVPRAPTKNLNESFKLNLYRFKDRTHHNVDVDFAARFFEDVAAGRYYDCSLVTGTVVPFRPIQERLLEKIEVGSTPRSNMLRFYFILLLDL